MTDLSNAAQERIDANVRAVLMSGWVAPPQGEVTEGLGSLRQRVDALWQMALEIERRRDRHLKST